MCGGKHLAPKTFGDPVVWKQSRADLRQEVLGLRCSGFAGQLAEAQLIGSCYRRHRCLHCFAPSVAELLDCR